MKLMSAPYLELLEGMGMNAGCYTSLHVRDEWFLDRLAPWPSSVLCDVAFDHLMEGMIAIYNLDEEKNNEKKYIAISI